MRECRLTDDAHRWVGSAQLRNQLRQLRRRAPLDVKPARLEVIARKLIGLRPEPIEIGETGAKDLDPPLVVLEQLPGARRSLAGPQHHAAQIDTHGVEKAAMLRIKIIAAVCDKA